MTIAGTFDDEGCGYLYVEGGPNDHPPIARTEPDPGAIVNVDYDEDGRIVGVEVVLGRAAKEVT
jgi:hypothetical protein